MKPQQREPKPVVILDGAGKVVDVASMNRKSYTKSTEQGELWVVHGDTGRVLPYEKGFRPLRISDEGRWYQATVEPAGEAAGAGKAGRAASSGTEGETADGRADGGGAPGRETGRSRPDSRVGAGGTVDAGAVLDGLCDVIARRRSERPEGSYTTYLFDAGEEKIRKKTGEEAIELVLARSRNETVSEAADLIYHLLVLLNQLEIPLNEVLEELARRAK